MTGALAGVHVLDVSSSPAGAWCGRLLAGFGADVVALSPESVGPISRLEPLDADGASIPWEYWSAGKRLLTIDPDSEGGKAELRTLAASSDVLVTTGTALELRAMGLSYDELDSVELILTHVTPWGFRSSRAEAPGPDLLVAARSGWAFINGLTSREPLQPTGWQPSYCGGLAACMGVIAAPYERHRTGLGQEIDVSSYDAMLAAFAPAFLTGQYSGTPVGRKSSTDVLAGPVPVEDGHFALTLSRAHFWRDAMSLLDLPDLAEDPRWHTNWYRQAHKEEYVSRVQERMAGWKKMALFEELALRRVVAGPVLTMAELAENEHLRGRGFWEHDQSGRAWPGAPLKTNATPWRAADEPISAPREVVGGHREEVVTSKTELKGPLDGVHALVLTQAWAGAFCTELLALMGADVIQVESRQRLDSWRGSYDGPMPRTLQDVPTAHHAWNCNPLSTIP